MQDSRPLKLSEISEVLKCRLLTNNGQGDHIVDNAGASDLMSDVLAFTKPGSVLLTGLTSVQVIRTAEMLDLKAIVFVRNKQPDANAIALAEEMKLPLYTSPYPLYEACGLLYRAGLPGSLGDSDPEKHWADRDNERMQFRVTTSPAVEPGGV